MPTIIARHQVGDFNTWIQGHQDRVDLFSPAISSFQTFQDTEDPNSVILVLEVTDAEKMQEIIKDPANNAVKARHTVLEPINTYRQVEVPAGVGNES